MNQRENSSSNEKDDYTEYSLEIRLRMEVSKTDGCDRREYVVHHGDSNAGFGFVLGRIHSSVWAHWRINSIFNDKCFDVIEFGVRF